MWIDEPCTCFPLWWRCRCWSKRRRRWRCCRRRSVCMHSQLSRVIPRLMDRCHCYLLLSLPPPACCLSFSRYFLSFFLFVFLGFLSFLAFCLLVFLSFCFFLLFVFLADRRHLLPTPLPPTTCLLFVLFYFSVCLLSVGCLFVFLACDKMLYILW